MNRWTWTLAAVVFVLAGPLKASKDCSNLPTGLTPLPELGTLGLTYQGMTGGLYPTGSNQIPPQHLLDGQLAARGIQPRDAAGNRDCANGRIVMVGLGMSLCSQTFKGFREQYSDPDPTRHPGLMLVNGTVGGTGAAEWAAGVSSSGLDLWQSVDDRLAAQAVTAQQVQVAFLFMVEKTTASFPLNAQQFRDNLKTICQRVRTEFPNCRIALLSSMTYLGWNDSPDVFREEPSAYERGFGVKWLIEDQIQGDPTLSFDVQSGVAPWLAWATYLWADGDTSATKPSACDDFSDGVHFSGSGVAKIAACMDGFFQGQSVHSIPTVTDPWYLAQPSCDPTPVALAYRYGEGCVGGNGKVPTINAVQITPTSAYQSLPYLGNTSFVLRSTFAHPQSNAYLVVGGAPVDPVPGPCNLLVDYFGAPLALFLTTVKPNGVADVDLPIPTAVGLRGFEFVAQFGIEDPGGGFQVGTSSYALSQGMTLRIGAP